MVTPEENISILRFRKVLFTIGFLSLIPACLLFEPDALLLVRTEPVQGDIYTAFEAGGTIIHLGEGMVSQHGFCWGDQTEPTLENGQKIELGSRNRPGPFSGTITGLAFNTTYYLRAYASDQLGTVYGEGISFKTLSPALPTLSTTEVSAITDSSAVSGGTITDNGGDSVLLRGICWSTVETPTIQDDTTADGGGSGSYSSNMTQLICGTTYYVRAYATGSAGTAYGQQKTFSTPACPKGLPSLTTVDITDTTWNSAQCGGNISSDGGDSVTVRGVCWSTSQDPTISDMFTTDGSGTGAFNSSITGLDPLTTYYVRAYATNSVGTAYGEQVAFTTSDTPKDLPALTTSPPTGISENSASSGGNISSDGGDSVVARGVCWSTSRDPTISDPHTSDGSGTGEFISSITGLDPSTTYYIRAYATNGVGTAYGDQVSFSTLEISTTVTDYDGNEYQIVEIGYQTWMAENLRTTHYADGTQIPHVEDQTAWGDFTTTDKGYCIYSNNESYTVSYGALYSWAAAMNGASSSHLNPSGVQGVCPSGWHLPSDAEWRQLELFLGLSREEADDTGWRGTDAGGKLKETGTVHWKDPNTGATNESGFTAMPGGWRNTAGTFMNRTLDGRYWTSTDHGGVQPWYRRLNYEKTGIYRDDYQWTGEGYSVRCLKDGEHPTMPVVSTGTVSGVTMSGAQAEGEVTSDGGASVTERGVCWSTGEDPTLSDSYSSDGSGTGTFTISVSGLECNTTYYVRAYATNETGTFYGLQESFTTALCPELPTVTTSAATNITETGAQSGGSVTDDGGAAVTAKGVCWGTTIDPTVSDDHTVDGSGTGGYTSVLSGLSCGTTYYVRAYATNAAGTAYGDEKVFTTSDCTTVTDIDGNVYGIILIGSQKWISENMKTTRYADGSDIQLVENGTAWGALAATEKAYCWYQNAPANGINYGAIYTWAAATNGMSSDASPSGVQGICPSGWHLPSDAEFKQLEIHLGMPPSEADGTAWRGTDEGGKLKATGTLHWTSPNTGADNESGFTARPGGSRSETGIYSGITEDAFFWVASEWDADNTIAWSRSLTFDRAETLRQIYLKNMGFSVRCVKD